MSKHAALIAEKAKLQKEVDSRNHLMHAFAEHEGAEVFVAVTRGGYQKANATLKDCEELKELLTLHLSEEVELMKSRIESIDKLLNAVEDLLEGHE